MAASPIRKLAAWKPRTTEKSTMVAERARASFNADKMMHIIDGGADVSSLRRRAYDIVIGDRILNDGLDRFTASVGEQRELTTRKIFRMADLMRVPENADVARHIMRAMEILDPAAAIRIFVQQTLWIGTLRNQGTPEQQALWLPGSDRYETIGCFGMTELGHSSFLRGAETKAVFEPSGDCFVINSTTLTATKWWIGQAGQIATHCILFANLETRGRACGVQLFIVPVRDRKTGVALPGVTIGDIGPKAGRHGNDNGFIIFDNVRIPRANMLARWASVDADGTFHAPPNPALAYGSTVAERVSSVAGAVDFVSQALTVALRFGMVRRQASGHGADGADGLEPQIMDYQSHKIGLLPPLARLYATVFTQHAITATYDRMVAELQAGNAAGFLLPLQEVHALSCGLKAFCTWWAADALEACRRSMGGHGYHAYSAMPRLAADFGVLTTGGGDNIVIAQQTARFLIKAIASAKAGKKAPPPSSSVAYLWAAPAVDPRGQPSTLLAAATVADLTGVCVHKAAGLFETVARGRIGAVAASMAAAIKGGASKGAAWDSHQMALVDAAEAHILAVLLRTFVTAVAAHDGSAEGAVLRTMARMLALSELERRSAWFTAAGLLAPSQLGLLREAVLALCDAMRPDTAALVDAFDLPDALLRAPLGARDGDIYEKYFAAAAANKINAAAAPYWAEVVAPRTIKSRL